MYCITPTSADENDTEADKPQDCRDILDNDETTPSGVYMVYPRDNLGGFLVFCDMDTDGGGWIVSTSLYQAPQVDGKILEIQEPFRVCYQRQRITRA